MTDRNVAIYSDRAQGSGQVPTMQRTAQEKVSILPEGAEEVVITAKHGRLGLGGSGVLVERLQKGKVP